ncbi:hemerythrin domain-containing protein [Sphingosinithalassobacter portus]|uniref:hemerythrin domain-containing protein n=1 Tax=Stakelama portus TaxID=2676234 RepID=UPI000D6E80C5|nr:hemerythrin domain-containing protein [Sphingosinithalassobacter portus]
MARRPFQAADFKDPSFNVSKLDIFFAEHRNLRERTAEMEALATQLEQPSIAQLNDARWRFTRTLLRTLTMKERIVYPRLRLHPDPKAREIARRFSESTAVDYERFANHTKRFPPETVIDHWPAYAAAVRLRTAEMHERMDREERDLFPLLENAPEIDALPIPEKNWAADGWRVRDMLGLDSPDDRVA